MKLYYLVSLLDVCIAVNMLFPVYAYVKDNSPASAYNHFDAKGFHSCFQRSRCSQIANTTFEGMICKCDPECVTFGDCCIDAVRSSSKTIMPQSCIDIGDTGNQGVYMINNCPRSYVGPEETRRMCLNDDFNDIANSAPVTDFINRQIYLNRYCAICNKVPVVSTKAWSISACRGGNSIRSLSDATYHPTEKKWGHEINGGFRRCEFVFIKPPSLKNFGRSCRMDYVSSCTKTSTGKDYWKACESYISVVKDSKGVLYKNPHCAVCNGVSLNDISCPPLARKNLFPNIYQILFDIYKAFGANRISRERNRSTAPMCPEGQRYDRRSGICRTVVCIFQGYLIRNDKCVKG